MSGQVQGFPLSPQQRRLWRLQSDSRAFRAQCAVELAGPLDEERLRAALAAAMGRHEILRTTFRRSPGIRFPIQAVSAAAAPLWQKVEASGDTPAARQAAADDLLRRAAARPFDLERGPVVHAWLARLAADRHLLALALPALCADRASLVRLVDEIAAHYAGARPGMAGNGTGVDGGAAEAAEGPEAPENDSEADTPVQYVQFAAWQQELLAGEESRAGREFWRAQLHPRMASLELPFEERGGAGGFAPERVAVSLAAGTLPRLQAAAGEQGAAPAEILLAAWQTLLWKLTGEAEAGAGVLFDGRAHGELAEALGPFARFLPIPWRMRANASFAELVASARRACEEAADWQDCHGADDDAAGSGPAACFELAPAAPARRAGDVELSLLRATAYCERFKVCLSAVQDGGELAAEIHYDSRRLAAVQAGALAERFSLLLAALAAGGTASRQAAAPARAPAIGAIGAIEILTARERQELLVEFNATAAGNGRAARPAHRLIEEQASRRPGALAVAQGELRLDFAELNRRANQLARYLQDPGAGAGVGPDCVIGLAVGRSPEMVVGMLGILKAGAAYLPLDANHPPERLAFMLADARVAVLLTEQRQLAALPAEALPGIQVLCLDSQWHRLEGLPGGDLAVEPSPDNLAYVIYTSGSTGQPKGVMVPHGALANYLAWAIDAYELAPDAAGADRGAPVHSPLGFDLTVTSLLAPLAAGASVSLISEELGIEPLAAALRDGGGFRVLKITPAHLALLQPALAGSALDGRVGTLVAGGEALPADAAASWRRRAPATRIVNEYGPTEATVGCCVYVVAPSEPGEPGEPGAPPPGEGGQAPAGATVPIGRPIANTRIYLLDDEQRPVPAGVPAELYLGGAGLARGYLGRPALTAERFVPDPLAGAAEGGDPGARLYRTGDLARFLAGGDLEFLGRNDHQVKVRGFRIELGEIEAVLALHPRVREAAVAAREDTPGETRLVAYWVAVADGEAAPSVDELRRFLAAKLPDYMVPALFLSLPALPLTANGKVDRAALPAPGSQRPDLEKEYVAPRDEVETTLEEIWSEVLGLDRIGVLDSFFALGGDSIRSVRVAALAKERGLDISVEQLFRRQTIAALAADLADLADLAGGGAAEAGAAGGLAAGSAAGAAPAGTSPPPAADEAALSRLLGELERLSDDEVQARLHEQAARGGAER
ncbi:MAG TPA: amino acid adenylation domain-containing protein [Thermoanaerobaculia bacterium]|nr:amino acid adenylation domain-containing protein [Thermoanaerobaculia bacterium]